MWGEVRITIFLYRYLIIPATFVEIILFPLDYLGTFVEH